MPWTEPGKEEDPNERPDDPWTGRKQRPLRLDEAIARLHRRINPQKNGSPSEPSEFPFTIGAAFLFLLWVLSGFFIVSPAEQAVVLRLGRYVETVGPGPHWIPRIAERAIKVDQQKILSYEYQKSDMLTRDENIVSVALAVWFRVQNPKEFLFNVVDPAESLHQATASALRQVIGSSDMAPIISSGRAEVVAMTKKQLTDILNEYHTGLEIADVVLRIAKAPDEVKDAFDDATKAQEEEQRLQNEAHAYANRVVPEARGKAERFIAEAEAYRQQVVLDAEADTVRFNAVYNRYREAPRVMRERMYFDAMQGVLSQTTKVLVDGKGSGNMFYLPLDKIMAQASTTPEPRASSEAPKSTLDESKSASEANPPRFTEASPSATRAQDNRASSLRRRFLSREQYVEMMRGKTQ